jgi:serine/threonine-protein kinase
MADVLDRLKAALADRYRIERELGSGGMATVYLAQDLKHHRRVAVKVLRPELSVILGSERFLKEIEVTANLQHPNILPLYDSGQADSFLYYVMPHIEGESLRAKLNRDKQLSVEEVVEIGRAVAAALDYAHQHEVIHRDIKPENILLQSGQALVADFGIALAVSAAGGTRLTETGLSLGTPQYMSPEQATGDRELDARTDVYSLGAVVYEMLTGDPPHSGSTVQAIVAKVLSERPTPISQTRDLVPTNVDAAVQRALAKTPADRFASAADFAAALTNPTFTLPTPEGGVLAGETPKLRMWRSVALALAVVATALGLWNVLRPTPQQPVARYGLAFPPGQELIDDVEPTFDAAPDGSWIVYVGPGEGGGQLWVKLRNRYDAEPLSGTNGARGPSVSPDGRWIAFAADGQLRKVAVDGGASITLADSARGKAVWLEDGTVVHVDLGWRLRRVPAAGGESETVQTPPSARYLVAPTPLPDSRGILYTLCDAYCRTVQEIWVLNLSNGEARRLLTGASVAWYANTGHVVFARPDGGVFGIPFDLGSLDTTGAAVPLLEGVKVDLGRAPDFTFSRNGTLLMMAGPGSDPGPGQQAVWISREGAVTPVDPDWRFESARNLSWALSPDGTRLAIGLNTQSGDDIWIKQLDNGPLSRLTFYEDEDARPSWTPDGQSVMFLSRRGEGRKSDLYMKRADGTGQPELLLDLESSIWEAARSPNGDWFVVRMGGQRGQPGARDIYGFRPGLDSARVPLLAAEHDEMAVALSPSGRWLAYASDESGRHEVYVRPFPDVESGRWQVSVDGGSSPLWAHSERELFYLTPENEMVSVAVQTGRTFEVGERRVLFTLGPGYVLSRLTTPFDISPDDQRFVMVRDVQAERPERTPLILVENWFEEVKEHVGQGND